MSEPHLSLKRRPKSKKDILEKNEKIDIASTNIKTKKSINTFNNNNDDIVEIMKKARELGLEIKQKEHWVNHTYRVQPTTRLEFNNACKALGISLQDGLNLAMNEFVQKRISK